MASVLKIPGKKTKGIISFSTQERDKFIIGNPKIEHQIKQLKKNWLFGIHHNWHDYNFSYNSLFDFHLAGKEDLFSKKNGFFKNSDLDCCNFPPDIFSFHKNNDKHWDILYVARPVFFKKIPEFYSIIKKLYDKKIFIRVLLICLETKKKFFFTDFEYEYAKYKKHYYEYFSDFERKYFNLIFLKNNSPFDIVTLSKFYNLSKVYVHTSNVERRSRTASYAFKSGMPVVCMKDVASILPKSLQKTPYLYLAKSYQEFPDLILQATNFVNSKKYVKKNLQKVINHFSYKQSSLKLIKFFEKVQKKKYSKQDLLNFYFDNLDYRLGSSFLNQNRSDNLDTFLYYIHNKKKNKLVKNFDKLLSENKINNYYLFQREASFVRTPFFKNILRLFKKILKYIFHFFLNKQP
jgi:hypothetical protein